MENENSIQPLDALMTKLGLTNAHLVEASTEQLSFKMVRKGRNGSKLTLNIQTKILNALLVARPGLNVKRRDLFRYEMEAELIGGIQDALEKIRTKKIKYPQFVDLLSAAGVAGYTADVAANRVTFFGSGGHAHVEQGPAISQDSPGRFYEEGIRSAIADAQKEIIDHPMFLKRIHEAGIVTYHVNCRSHKIEYKGEKESYKETISSTTPEIKIVAPKIEEKKSEKKPKKKPVKNKKKSKTRKARLSANKRHFKKRR